MRHNPHPILLEDDWRWTLAVVALCGLMATLAGLLSLGAWIMWRWAWRMLGEVRR
jgi:hypothetical protein